MKARPSIPNSDEVLLPEGLRFTFSLLGGPDAHGSYLHTWSVLSPSGEVLRRGYTITPEGSWNASREALRRWPVVPV